ncbi:MAG TPA: cupin domain-containing protein [Gaiellaceae bacterium]|jgi:mannose-6-phosphate isomerase-like protein (cupin superfamily)
MHEQLWFLDTLVTVHVPAAAGTDAISVLESNAPHGDSPPLHVHAAEDEAFHVLEGEVRLVVGDDELRLGPGDSALGPKGIPHTYRVESAEGARVLVVTQGGEFEGFVRDMSRPAERAELPEPAGPPTPEAIGALAAAAAPRGIEFVGPPL